MASDGNPRRYSTKRHVTIEKAEMASDETYKLKPSYIRFSQNTIEPKLTKEDRIKDLIDKIKSEDDWRVNVSDPVTVVIRDRKLYSLNNRRLYAARHLEIKKCIDEIPVFIRKYDEKLDEKKFTTQNNGETIAFENKHKKTLEHYTVKIPKVEDMQMDDNTRSKIVTNMQDIAEPVCKKKWSGKDSAKQQPEQPQPKPGKQKRGHHPPDHKKEQDRKKSKREMVEKKNRSLVDSDNSD